MTQFLDKGDGKWHITMFVDIPRLVIRNHLNFRIYSTTSFSGVTTRDPHIIDSNHTFHITPNLLGKKVFFSMSFTKAAIANIDTFRFGLCDENVGWHHATFLDVRNEYRGCELIISNVEAPATVLFSEIESECQSDEPDAECVEELSIAEPTPINSEQSTVIQDQVAPKTGYQKKTKRKTT